MSEWMNPKKDRFEDVWCFLVALALTVWICAMCPKKSPYHYGLPAHVLEQLHIDRERLVLEEARYLAEMDARPEMSTEDYMALLLKLQAAHQNDPNGAEEKALRAKLNDELCVIGAHSNRRATTSVK